MIFDEIFIDDTKNATKIPVTKYKPVGKYPIIDQSKSFISGYLDENSGIYNNVPVIIFGDHTRIIKYIDKPLFIGADGVKLLNIKIDCNIKYLYYYLKSKDIPNLGYSRHFKLLKDLEFNIPNTVEQNNIVGKLDKICLMIDKRQQQLNRYDELVKSQFIEMFGDPDLSYQKESWDELENVGEIVGGSTPKTSIKEYWNGDLNWFTPAEIKENDFIVNQSERKITELGAKSCSLRKMPINTVILSSRAPIGKVALAGCEFYCNQGFKNIVCNENLNPIFLLMLLKYNNEYLNSLGRGATFKEISKTIVSKIKIPTPPIELQNQFADFVKHIDKLKFQEIITKLKKLCYNIFNIIQVQNTSEVKK